MRVYSEYRTIILQLNPDRETKRDLKKFMDWTQSFIDMSRIEIQKLLYNKWKEYNIPMSTSMVSLLSQRFSGSATGKDKRFIYLYNQNSRFIFDKEWFLEAQFQSRNGKYNPQRIRIPVHRTEVPYYADIQDMIGYSVMITEEAEKWFAYVQIPVKFENEGIENKVVGIDFNFNKWIASMKDDRPLIFNSKSYGDEIDRISSLISRKQSYMRLTNDPDRISELEKEINELYALRTAVVKRAHGEFISAIMDRFGYCTLVVEDVSTMFRLTMKENGMTNNWLYKKTSLSQFQLRAVSHGFNIIEINPSFTSQACHRCGHLGINYGKGKRLFRCTHCGLKDYHRDINAARNIAKIGSGELLDYKLLSEERKKLKSHNNS